MWWPATSLDIVKAVMLEVPEALLAQRRALGLDGLDEVWDGVLHMVPPPGEAHQEVAAELFVVLAPLAKRAGLVARFETGLYRTADDYRVPDQLCRRPEAGSPRGAESAELVVEILSAHDETPDKVDWYADLGVRELLVVDPVSRRCRLHRLGHGEREPVEADEDGVVSEVLDVRIAHRAGRMRLTWSAADGSTGSADV